jgi:hypothetical protein
MHAEYIMKKDDNGNGYKFINEGTIKFLMRVTLQEFNK